MISMKKQYKTRDGRPVRILCVDAVGDDYPVIALVTDHDRELVCSFTADGHLHREPCETESDLVEVGPYDDFKVDDPVMVRDHGNQPWRGAYFARVNEDGNPTVWHCGATSWTTSPHQVLVWNQCRRPTPEELNQGVSK